MKKFRLMQVYNCDKRRRMIYHVVDITDDVNYHLTEEEWQLVKDEEMSYQEAEEYRAKLEAKIYLQAINDTKTTKKRRRK